jgi:hypothetical protein
VSLEATKLALRLYNAPASLSRVRKDTLPEGLETLLEIAAGDMDAVNFAAARVGRSAVELRLACGFYVEQVLLADDADDYRVLGCSRTTPMADILRRRTLLLRWLHPDVKNKHVSEGATDRSMFAARVVSAWQRVNRTGTVTDQGTAATASSSRRKRSSTAPAKRDHNTLIETLRSYFYGGSNS